MAANSKNSKKSGSARQTADKTSVGSKRKFKLILWGCAVLLILGAVTWGIIKLPAMFYSRNPRIRFRNIEIDSTGWFRPCREYPWTHGYSTSL